MKKTLMVLTFALCATFVFAQTATPHMKGVAKASTKENPVQKGNASSIFTKDGATLCTVDFSADNQGYSTGVITGGLEGHGQNYDYAMWRRWPNVDSLTLVNASSTYPYITQLMGGPQNFYRNIFNWADTATSSAENGFMFMLMYEQRSRFSGNFNAFIRIDSIDVSTANVIDVRFFQRYRKYYDNCYIDYNTTGNIWNEVEINVTGVDLGVNDDLAGFISYSLPVAAASGDNVNIRIRWKSLDAAHSYGYWWLIDDVSVVAGDNDRMKKFTEEYVEGNYGMIPQNMQINPAWFGIVQNNGSNTQNNVIGTIHHLNAAQDVETEIDMYNNQTIPYDEFKNVVVDKAGWLYMDSLEYRGWYGYIDHTPHGTGVNLPTETLGDNFIFTTLGNSSLNLDFDTQYYRVTGLENGYYRWGHDNGVLVYLPTNIWCFGYIEDGGTWFVSEDPEDVTFYGAGYTVTSRFTTDANVPEGWVIRGVELVASPVNGYHSTGARLSSVLLYDDYDGGSVRFPSIMTGANVKTITDQDVNDSLVIGRNSAGYLEPGNYHTVIINFPEQPALEPNTSYRIGYSLEDDSYFALAHESYGTYRIASPTRPDEYDTIIRFRNNEATAKYARYFAPNQYQNYINDPSYGGTGSSSTFARNSVNPMIRMLVGPAQAVNRVNINIECENTDYGTVAYGGEEKCGETITPVEGSTATVVASTATWCTVDSVIVDGVSIEPWDEVTEEGDPHLLAAYDSSAHVWMYQYIFDEVMGDHTIKFIFAEGEAPIISIDPAAAGVRMNLQPNPATSLVNMNIEGVTGMVNCMLIDMSGRVVYNQNVNAETAQTINVSNLAKGAYFVRITNDKFTKVEKLIVR